MGERPYMKLWIADYLGDTQHLSTEQHGVYLLLLMTMWRADGILPNDPVKLARIARVSARKWKTLSPDVMDLFEVKNDRVTHKRLVKELRDATDKSDAASENAKRRWLKNNDTGDADAVRAQCNGNASHSHSQLVPNGTNKNSRAKRGHVLPDDWLPTPDDEAWADARKYPADYRRAQTEAMQNWAWGNQNRAIARKADWSKTWRNWLDREWPKWRGTGPPKTRTQLATEQFLAEFSNGNDNSDGSGEISGDVRGELPKPASQP